MYTETDEVKKEQGRRVQFIPPSYVLVSNEKATIIVLICAFMFRIYLEPRYENC